METVIQADLTKEKQKKKGDSSQENIKRSILKTISWRVVGTITTVTVSYVITGTMALAFSIGGIELVSKMLLYFFHERAWNNIKWGK